MRRAIALLLCFAGMWITRAETLKVGVFLHAPIVMQANPGGEPFGPGIDYAKAVVRALGYEPEIRVLPIARILANLKDGSLDLALELGMTEERKAFLLYPDLPCLSSHPSLTVLADNPLGAVSSTKDLAGIRVGYLLGAYAGSFFAGKTNVEFEYVSGETWVAQNLGKLLAGRIDAILDQNEYSCLAEARRQGVESRIKTLLLPVADIKAYVVFSRATPKSERLLRLYNAIKDSSVPNENTLLLRYLDSIGR